MPAIQVLRILSGRMVGLVLAGARRMVMVMVVCAALSKLVQLAPRAGINRYGILADDAIKTHVADAHQGVSKET